MLDFADLINTPGYDVQYFNSDPGSWLTWKKPRGAKMVYILCVGGGASGGCGLNTATSSGGGAGGASGSQSVLLIPAMFVPDILYVQCGAGGEQPTTLVSGALCVAGGPSYVSIVPSTVVSTLSPTLITLANGGPVSTTVPTTTAGGTASAAAAAPLIYNMYLSSRGIPSFYLGNAGGTGGSSTAVAPTRGTTTAGCASLGGTGGGGSSATPSAGGQVSLTSNSISGNLYLGTTLGGFAASGATPARAGGDGPTIKYGIQNYGGFGGGGASTTAGGIAGAGGDGAPGAGGGGAGGSNTTNSTLARPGNGGDGFVYIVSF